MEEDGMTTPIKTLTIQELSDRAGISKHTLRFWEKELNGVIMPLRTKGGQRRYTLEHVLVVEEIKRLKGKGQSLDDIRRDLGRRFNTEEEHYNHQKADVLANKIAEMVRTAIFSFLENKIAKE
jgi:DNA-binding transcriptional MerR regulator